jgi:hypothetical protein
LNFPGGAVRATMGRVSKQPLPNPDVTFTELDAVPEGPGPARPSLSDLSLPDITPARGQPLGVAGETRPELEPVPSSTLILEDEAPAVARQALGGTVELTPSGGTPALRPPPRPRLRRVSRGGDGFESKSRDRIASVHALPEADPVASMVTMPKLKPVSARSQQLTRALVITAVAVAVLFFGYLAWTLL